MHFFRSFFQYCMVGMIVSIIPAAHAQQWHNEPEITAIFKEAGITGTFVLYQPEQNTFRGTNPQRAKTAYHPASTFKILNSLIAFETGIVHSETEILPYGGQPQTIKAWEHDMNIAEAMAVSNVPIYQGIARRIGLEKMAEFVRKSHYGNQQIGHQVDNFWLVGPLEISAIEQTRFIQALLKRTLPFSADTIRHLENIVPVEQGEKGKLFFKTGWAVNQVKPDTGWLVGWVNTNGKNYPFALNIDMYQDSDAKQRITLVRASLKALGLF